MPARKKKTKPTAEIIELGPHDNMTPTEALAMTLRNPPEAVFLIYYNEDGTLGTRSSGMPRKDALWMLEFAKMTLFNEEEE